MVLSGYAWGASIIDLITLAAFLQFPKSALFAAMREEDFLHTLKRGEYSLFESSSFDRLSSKKDRGSNSKLRNLQNSEKTRMFVADDFIRLLLIFHEVSEKIVELAGEGTPEEEEDVPIDKADDKGLSTATLKPIRLRPIRIASNASGIPCPLICSEP